MSVRYAAGGDFYIRKDFDPKVGLTVVIVGALISAVFYWFGEDLIAYSILGGAALIDLFVYGRLGDVTVCYRCHSEFRGKYPADGRPLRPAHRGRAGAGIRAKDRPAIAKQLKPPDGRRGGVYRFESPLAAKPCNNSVQYAKTPVCVVQPSCRRSIPMWNKDEVQGKTEEVKGKAKQAAGDLTDDENLQAEGEAQELGGKVQKGFGKAKREVGNAIKDVGDAIKK